jgi:hypothetical protein
MPPPKEDPREVISRYFDCSDLKNRGKWGLTHNNIRAIYHYTGQSGVCASEIVNPVLRSVAKQPADEQQVYFDNLKVKIVLSSIQTFVKQMDKAIGKVALPEGLLVYRGIDYDRVTSDLGSDIGIGMKIRDAGYMSTSYSEGVAFQFAVPNLFDEGDIKRMPLFVIQIKPGRFGAVSHHECEVILPRGSVLHCIDIVDSDNRRYFIMDYVDVVKGVEV